MILMTWQKTMREDGNDIAVIVWGGGVCLLFTRQGKSLLGVESMCE